MTSNDKLYINGIDAVTGEYLVQPMDYDEATALIEDETVDTGKMYWLRHRLQIISQPHLGLPLGQSPEIVEQAGWGVAFRKDEDAAVKGALRPLIEHRRRHIHDDTRVKVLEYRDGEDTAEWLTRHNVREGTVDPTKVPYYLLLVGSPERIPFSFGHQLDVEYAVGRLHFDKADEYRRYAESLIAYETGESVPNRKDVVFFGTRHAFDRATQISADLLVNPLVDGTPNDPTTMSGIAQQWGFRSHKVLGAAATKQALSDVFTPAAGAERPSILFTATHGMGLPKGHVHQRAAQGALLCQDWPGFGTISPDHYFAAKDVPANGQFHGLVTFHFACYGAGTPSQDRFFHKRTDRPLAIADRPFLAALPGSLLTHPNGGALACIGHVDRAWSCSIGGSKAGAQLLPFRNAIGRLLIGQPIGYAMKDFKERYAALSTRLASMLEQLSARAQISNFKLASAWIERNDAEGYIVVGDPAVQLRVKELQLLS